MITPATSAPKDDSWLTWKNVKKVALVALQIMALVALLLWQPVFFLIGFSIGFIARLANPECTEKAVKKVLSAIGNRPGLFCGLLIGATLVLPPWLAVGPPLVGGFYGGYKAAKWFQLQPGMEASKRSRKLA